MSGPPGIRLGGILFALSSPCIPFTVSVMAELETTQSVPMIKGDDGVIRIKGSRVTLDSVVWAFQQGATAEQIQEDFPSLALREIYGVIAYYLEHPAAVEAYLAEQKQQAVQTRHEIETGQDSASLRQRLRQRRTQLVR